MDKAYLTPHKDGAEGIEELKGRQDVALNQQARHDSGSGPPSRADGHLKEPLLQRQGTQIATSCSSQHCSHVVSVYPKSRNKRVAM